MGNSSIRLRDIVSDAFTLGDVAPALATGGSSDAPALSAANDCMSALCLGGPDGQPFNWKWNRFNVTPWPTISLQQDNFVPGVVNLGWLESAWCTNVNQTSIPKTQVNMETRRDLQISFYQFGVPDKVCWIPNDQCQTGTWGQAPLGPTAGFPSGQINVSGPSLTGMQNPGPNVIYTNPIGTLQTPANATTCIKDPNGNLWVLTTFGTCGDTEPTWPDPVTYPTYQNSTIVATTIADGSCVWTAVNPKGQGFRLNPIPSQSGVVWLVQCVGQMRVPYFTSLNQTLDPIPDDYATYFKQGFFAECFRRSPDPKVRAKYPQERQLWLEALSKAVKQGDSELNDFGFVPSSPIMDAGYSWGLRPDWPYSGGSY